MNFIGFSSNHEKIPIEFENGFRKLKKKDSVTKLKGFETLENLVVSMSVEDIQVFEKMVKEYFFIYSSILCKDLHYQVKVKSHKLVIDWLKQCSKPQIVVFRKYYQMYFISFWKNMHQHRFPKVGALGRHYFELLFQRERKRIQIVEIGLKEYVDQMLLDLESCSDTESTEALLDGVIGFLKFDAERNGEKSVVFGEDQVSCIEKLWSSELVWKLLHHKESKIRRQMYHFVLLSISQENIRQWMDGKWNGQADWWMKHIGQRWMCLISEIKSENQLVMWEMLLSVLNVWPVMWKMVPKERVHPHLWKMLKNGMYGSGNYACLLPLIANTPLECWKQDVVQLVLTNLWYGMSALRQDFNLEKKAMKAYFEIALYLAQQNSNSCAIVINHIGAKLEDASDCNSNIQSIFFEQLAIFFNQGLTSCKDFVDKVWAKWIANGSQVEASFFPITEMQPLISEPKFQKLFNKCLQNESMLPRLLSTSYITSIATQLETQLEKLYRSSDFQQKLCAKDVPNLHVVASILPYVNSNAIVLHAWDQVITTKKSYDTVDYEHAILFLKAVGHHHQVLVDSHSMNQLLQHIWSQNQNQISTAEIEFLSLVLSDNILVNQESATKLTFVVVQAASNKKSLDLHPSRTRALILAYIKCPTIHGEEYDTLVCSMLFACHDPGFPWCTKEDWESTVLPSIPASKINLIKDACIVRLNNETTQSIPPIDQATLYAQHIVECVSFGCEVKHLQMFQSSYWIQEPNLVRQQQFVLLVLAKYFSNASSSHIVECTLEISCAVLLADMAFVLSHFIVESREHPLHFANCATMAAVIFPYTVLDYSHIQFNLSSESFSIKPKSLAWLHSVMCSHLTDQIPGELSNVEWQALIRLAAEFASANASASLESDILEQIRDPQEKGQTQWITMLAFSTQNLECISPVCRFIENSLRAKDVDSLLNWMCLLNRLNWKAEHNTEVQKLLLTVVKCVYEHPICDSFSTELHVEIFITILALQNVSSASEDLRRMQSSWYSYISLSFGLEKKIGSINVENLSLLKDIMMLRESFLQTKDSPHAAQVALSTYLDCIKWKQICLQLFGLAHSGADLFSIVQVDICTALAYNRALAILPQLGDDIDTLLTTKESILPQLYDYMDSATFRKTFRAKENIILFALMKHSRGQVPNMPLMVTENEEDYTLLEDHFPFRYRDDSIDFSFISNLNLWNLLLSHLDRMERSDHRVQYKAVVSQFVAAKNLLAPILGACVEYLHENAKQFASDFPISQEEVDTEMQTIFCTLQQCTSSSEENYLDRTVQLTIYRTVAAFPVLVRAWWNDNCSRQVKANMSTIVQDHVAPLLFLTEASKMVHVDDLSIKSSRVSREIRAKCVKDECELEMTITIPSNYPLRSVDVTCTKKMGISEDRWRRWVLQILKVTSSQDGSILDAILLWKHNVDKEFDGVEPCPICYSILHPKTFALPKLCCRTCSNKYHSACLYKWFNQSGKNKCPVCQQPFCT